MKNIINWNFDNSYSRLSNAFKEHVKPIAVKNPELVLFNEGLARELNLDFTKIDKNEKINVTLSLTGRLIIKKIELIKFKNRLRLYLFKTTLEIKKDTL